MHALRYRTTYVPPRALGGKLVADVAAAVTSWGLRFHFWMYCRAVRRGLFPQDEREHTIAGPSPERVLFVGDVAVAGYGVLRHGMGTAAQTAAVISAHTGRGVTWSSMTAFDLTARKVATLPCEGTYDIDRVVFMMGIPDVLLGTTAEQWSMSLQTVLNRSRSAFGENAQVVFAAIPPMHNFRPMPPVARALLRRQVNRLNAAAVRVIEQDARTGTAIFVPSPAWDATSPGDLIEARFSWRDLHRQWAHALGAAATTQPSNEKWATTA